MTFLKGSLFLMISSGAVLGTISYFIYYYRNQMFSIRPSLPLIFSKSPASSMASSDLKAALSPDDFRSFQVLSNVNVSHNTHRVRFALPQGTQRLGLTIASCLLVRIPITKEAGKYVIRPYTPVTTEDENTKNGYFELIVKGYKEGIVSKHIAQLKANNSLEMKGPILKLNLLTDPRLAGKSNIGLIAGGTGITPMLQVLKEVLLHDTWPESINPLNQMKFTLLFANQEERDILCKEYLDELMVKFPNRFTVHYVVSRPGANWPKAFSGLITKEMITKLLPSSKDSSSMIFVCGPDSMLSVMAGPKNPDKSQGELAGYLKDLGFTENNVFKF